MNNLAKKYEITKEKADGFMKKGLITKYLEALMEMNKCERLMTAIIAN